MKILSGPWIHGAALNPLFLFAASFWVISKGIYMRMLYPLHFFRTVGKPHFHISIMARHRGATDFFVMALIPYAAGSYNPVSFNSSLMQPNRVITILS